MENEIEIDEKILGDICNILDELTTPDNEILMNIFIQFQNLYSKLETFCFYLLRIISLDQFPLKRRFLALIVLNRNFRQIPDNLVEEFVSIAKPLLEEIIRQPYSPLTSNSATMLCSMIKFYGFENFPDFYDQIAELISNEDTVQVGLECLREMVENGQNIPDELLEVLPELINSPYCQLVLDICYSMLRFNSTYIIESILPVIFEQYSDFDEDSLSQAGSISAYLYLYSPTEDIGNFLIECFSYNSVKVNENILNELNQTNSFKIYPPLIEALLQLMEFPDDDVTEFGPCSMSQQILQVLADCYGGEFNRIVKTFINGHFTFIPELYESIKGGRAVDENLNVGFFLRCIYTILPTLRETVGEEEEDQIEEEFDLYFTIIDGCFESVFRGDAALTLMSFCFANAAQCVSESFKRILPLLTDEDEGVQFQAYVALDELVGFEELDPEIDQFAFLIDLMESTNKNKIANLAYRYLRHFPVLNDSNDYILNLYHDLLVHFISVTIQISNGIVNGGSCEEESGYKIDENSLFELALTANDSESCENDGDRLRNFSFVTVSNPIFQSLVDLLSMLIKIVVEPFDLIDKRIFVSVLFALKHDSFDSSMFLSYFKLLRSLLSTYIGQISSEIEEESKNSEFDFFNVIELVFQKVVEILVNESTSSLHLMKNCYSVILIIISHIQPIQCQLIEDETQSLLVEKLLTFSSYHFTTDNKCDLELEEDDEVIKKETSALNVKICSLIDQILTFLIPKMDSDLANSFLQNCCSIIEVFEGGMDVESDEIVKSTSEIKNFGRLLIELFDSNDSPIDEGVRQLFLD